MRLLNTRSLELRSFVPRELPDYVILSHRWGPEEVTLKDIIRCPVSAVENPARQLMGFSKVKGACKLAADDGYDWIWIDSCCIDKESSADVDKSINSMWTYYTRSNICYVYMADVPDYETGWGVKFRESEWFTRGWTLQELIAPVYVEFYAADWSPIGTKLERHEEIAAITTIHNELLAQNRSIEAYGAAERFSWAAHRQVTQEEDEAYSLLGLFQIHMPMLYGEGRGRAFARLQEAIYLSTCDDSIFLFCYSPHIDSQPLLADCPTRFCQRAQCEPCQRQGGTQCFPSQVPYTVVMESDFWTTQAHEQIITTVTSFRNEISVPLYVVEYADISSKLIFFDDNEDRTWASHVAVLNYTTQFHSRGAFCLLLYRPSDSIVPCFYRLSNLPAILPNVGEFTSRIQKTKILVPGPVLGDKNPRVDTTFSVSTDSYCVQGWTAKCVDTREVLRIQESSDTEFENTAFKVQTGDKEWKNHAEVSCRVASSQSLDDHPQILVQLEKIVEICKWSIKEVFEVGPRRRLDKHRIFLAKTPSDRCMICLSNGEKLSVGLRPLAAINSPSDARFISQQRYQIFIRPMKEGHMGHRLVDVNLT
ncbi:heterokaryon incompatibility protein-domain-containing protein [Leptodontidium sp. MPI-SDFR-AT-0119]|nr:heterokaryon incompatibility protein-domain-containing protein [Leptodontidium sp. MPI-SDFR-AT-0119]